MSPAPRRSLLLAIAALALFTAAAEAVPGPLPSSYVTDAPVTSIVTDNQGRAYVGGDFAHVGPRLGHGIVLTTSSSTPAPGFPDINGDVYAAVADGAGGWFIGGAFTSVGGVARSALAHIKADRTLDTSWNPGPNNIVRSLALSGGTLYVGGDFTQVGGVAHAKVAKVDATTGAVDATWLPPVTGSVGALAVDASFVYIGTTGAVGGLSTGLGRVSATGAGDHDGTWPMFVSGGPAKVVALALSGTTLYAGGAFTTAGGSSHGGLAKINTASNPGADPVDPAWSPSPYVGGPDGVRALAPAGGGSLIVGGSFPNGIGKVDAAGTVDPTWHPDVDSSDVRSLAISGDNVIVGGSYYSTLGGQPHASLGKVSLSTGTPDLTWSPNPGAAVDALAFSGSSLFAGGTFASAGPQNAKRVGLARFKTDGTLDTGWDADLDGAVQSLLLSGSSLYVGGWFQHVGAASQPGLARLTADTAAFDTGWRPALDQGPVAAMALSGSDLFIGGSFTQVGVVNRHGLAKLGTASPVTLDGTWDPGPNGLNPVNALAVSGSSLYVGGSFTFFTAGSGGGTLRNRIARIPTSGDGAPDSWDPNATSGSVNALAISGSDVFAGGGFGNIGGLARNRLAKLSADSNNADPNWNPNASGTVYALALDGDRLYVAGAFTKVSNQDRLELARLSTTGTGAPDSVIVPPATNGILLAVAPASSGRLFVGGTFSGLGANSLSGIGLYDLTAPAASVTAPAEGGRYPQGKSVTAAYSCSDPDGAANVVSCTGPVASGAAFDTSTAGPNTFTVTATDAGGGTGSTTVNYVVDASAPTISVSVPAEGATFTRGQAVNAAYSCGDADGAGDVASCAGPVASGAPIDTSTGGTHTFAVTATDVAGNSTTNTVSYTVTVPDRTAPAITGWRIRPTSFRAAASGASVGAARAARKPTPTGARVSYALSEAAPKIVVTVLQLRKHKKPLSLGRFTIKGKAGANRFKFTGRINGGKLAPGSYRLSARATDAAKNTSKTAVADFKIVKR